MSDSDTPTGGRSPRNLFPVLVKMDDDRFTVRDYRIDVEAGGIFLRTDQVRAPGTRATLKFRISQFDEPFALDAEVVHCVPPGDENARAGMSLMFDDLDEQDRAHLTRVIEGVRSGSVVQTIRDAVRSGEQSAEVTIRHRPTDQKLMLAPQAQPNEIEILIREGNPSVLIRLLDNPRLQSQHVMMMLRNRNQPTRVLSAIYREKSLLANEECRFLFCTHPAAMLGDVMRELPRLPPARLQRIEQDGTSRPQVRAKARDLGKKRDPFRR